jgi:hypothetical protein
VRADEDQEGQQDSQVAPPLRGLVDYDEQSASYIVRFDRLARGKGETPEAKDGHDANGASAPDGAHRAAELQAAELQAAELQAAELQAAELYRIYRAERRLKDLETRIRKMGRIIDAEDESSAHSGYETATDELTEKLGDYYEDPEKALSRLEHAIDQHGFIDTVEAMALRPERFGPIKVRCDPISDKKGLWALRDNYERGAQTAGEALRIYDRDEVSWALAAYALARAAWLQRCGETARRGEHRSGAKRRASDASSQSPERLERELGGLRRAYEDAKCELEAMPTRNELRDASERLARESGAEGRQALQRLHDRVDELKDISVLARRWRAAKVQERLAWNALYARPESARDAFHQTAPGEATSIPAARRDETLQRLKTRPEQFGSLRDVSTEKCAQQVKRLARALRNGSSLADSIRTSIEELGDKMGSHAAITEGKPSKSAVSQIDVRHTSRILGSQEVGRGLMKDHWEVSQSQAYRGITRSISRF